MHLLTRSDGKIWAARALIALVFFFNVQCALVFIIAPARFAPGFELSGPTGDALVRSIGILFLMWNVPYAVAIGHPLHHRLSLIEATIMQAIGLLGEVMLLLTLRGDHPALRATASRFIIFDSLGLIALLFAGYLAATLRKQGNANDL